MSPQQLYFCIIQEAALEVLKSANPDGRFWLKLVETYVKAWFMESVKAVWNGLVMENYNS